MSILAMNHRFGACRVLSVALCSLRRDVHLGVEIGVVAEDGALEVNRTRRVELVDPFLHGSEVLRVGSLVAHRPVDHRRMVELVVHVVHVALHYLLGEEVGCCDSVAIVEEAVTLLVGLSAYIYTIFVAKLVEVRVVRVVACAHGVHVELLHQLHVLNHAFA